MTRHGSVAAACLAGLVFALPSTSPALGAETEVFSGPRPGNPTPPFTVLDVLRSPEPGDRDPVTENGGAPTAWIFVHGIERSMAPLLRTLDTFGTRNANHLRTEFVFLTNDPLNARNRIPTVARALSIGSRVGLYLEHPGGPGDYALNPDCLMTVVVARDNRVRQNFALVQPGIADAERIIAAIADTADIQPPESIADLVPNPDAGRGRRMAARPAMEADRDDPWAGLDLESEAGLRDAVRRLIREVETLKSRLGESEQPGMTRTPDRPARSMDAANPSREPRRETAELPGAAPTDPDVVALLRRFIQRSNTPAQVDQVLEEVRALTRDDTERRRQVIGGWTRVIHLEYGTEYAREAGRKLLAELER